MARRKLLKCVVPACGKRECARGLCAMHYQRWRRGERSAGEFLRPSLRTLGVPSEVLAILKNAASGGAK